MKFGEDDYAAREEDGVMAVSVITDSGNSAAITVRVTPMTFEQYEQMFNYTIPSGITIPDDLNFAEGI